MGNIKQRSLGISWMDLKIHSLSEFNSLGTLYFPNNIGNKIYHETLYTSETFYLEFIRNYCGEIILRWRTLKGNGSFYCNFTLTDELTKTKLCYIYLGSTLGGGGGEL